MLCQIQALAVPSGDTPAEPVIVVSFDDCKYLFNCGEGAQRSMLAAKFPIRKVKEVFLTSGWQSHGGLASLLLSISSHAGQQSVGVHGPKNLIYYLASLRAGQQRAYATGMTMQLSIEEYEDSLPPPYDDKNVVIQPVLAFPEKGSRESSAVDSVTAQPQVSKADIERVTQIAQTVWSGDILERDTEGVWTAIKQKRDLDVPAVRVPSRKRSYSTLESTSQDENEKPRVDHARPSADQYRASQNFMSEDLPDGFQPFSAAVSYFIQGKSLRGKFNPIRAKELGVPPGPLYSRLQNGYTVTNPHGQHVHSEDVVGPKRICPAVMFISCPHQDYIDNLCTNSFWATCIGEKQPSAILHSCSTQVFSDDRYIKFMASFGSQVKHLLTTNDAIQDHLTHKKFAEHAKDLQRLSDDIYHPPEISSTTADLPVEKFEQNAINYSRLETEFRINPFPMLNITKTADVTEAQLSEPHKALLEQFRQECVSTKEKVAALEQEQQQQTDTSGEDPGDNIEILTLGTGSAGPSNHRNVSGTMILDSKPDGHTILLDCGENTVGQIRRAFGQVTPTAMQALRLVFISHLHADHHLGLIGLIKLWLLHNADNENKLFIICPLKLGRSVLEYGNIDAGFHLHRVVLINGWHMYQYHQRNTDNAESSSLIAYAELRRALPGISSIFTVPAVHSEKAMSVRINHRDGWSVAYSGDTRPNSGFVKLARGVTCLIHEATFEDDKLDEAYKKKHSTIAEALQVTRDAQAKHTILTHLSQRYPKVPVVTDTQLAELSDCRVGFAVDLMRVKMKDVWKLGHHLQPQINLAKGLADLKIQEDDETEQVILDDV